MDAAKLRTLGRLHARTHACTKCFGDDGCAIESDPARVPRALPARRFGPDVVLIGEALGPTTQRLSGLPYIDARGELRTTGRTLDEFLRRFGYTIDPKGSLKYAYSTDLVRCFPQANAAERPRPPTRKEVLNCSEWLDEELTILRPRFIVLLGRLAASYFFQRYFGLRVHRLRDVVGGPHWLEVDGRRVGVYAVPHPSPLAAGKMRTEAYERAGASIARFLADDEDFTDP